jgi:hypothetical protein
MIALVYVLAYAFYNLEHLSILYAIPPGSQDVVQNKPVRFLSAAAALLAACGAVLLT